MPYKLSPFSAYKEDVTSSLDVIKVFLNLYNMYAVWGGYKFLKDTKAEQLGVDKDKFQPMKQPAIFIGLIIGTIAESLVDIIIVLLQTLAFIIKVFDTFEMSVDPYLVLEKESRFKFQGLYFVSENFRNF